MCGGVFRGPKTPKQPEIKPIAPTPTDTTSTDVSNVADVADVAADLERQRKKRGYASTRTSADRETIAGGAGKKTLG